MGVGAAAVMPTTLSIITTSFPPEERGRAVGVWVGVAGGGAVIGLFGSGILLEFFSWNSFFALNVTLAVLALVGTLAVDPDLARAAGARLDGRRRAVAGRRRGSCSRSSRGRTAAGPPAHGRGRLAVGARRAGRRSCCWELHTPEPMLDPRLFRLRGFSPAPLSMTAQFFASFGFFFIVLQYLQYVAGRSPLRGRALAAAAAVRAAPLARKRPDIAARFGTNRVVAARAAADRRRARRSSRSSASTSPTGTSTPASSCSRSAWAGRHARDDRDRRVAAGGEAGRRVGGQRPVPGVRQRARHRGARQRAHRQLPGSLAPTLAGLPAPVAEGARASVAFASEAAGRLGPVGQQLAAAARQAYVDGVSAAVLTGAAVLVAAAVFVFFRAPKAAERYAGGGRPRPRASGPAGPAGPAGRRGPRRSRRRRPRAGGRARPGSSRPRRRTPAAARRRSARRPGAAARTPARRSAGP